jgi:chromosome transmission fidelity protein 1
LSLLCGSLTWLRNHKSRDLEEQLNAEEQGILTNYHIFKKKPHSHRIQETDGPSWVYEHSRREKKAKILRSREDLENRLNAIREKETREKAKARNLDVAFIKKLASEIFTCVSHHD